MIFNSKIDTVNYKLSNSVRFMDRLNISKLAGQEYTIMGFIYRLYDDGYRCFFVTEDAHLIRLPKWYSSVLNNLTVDELEVIKSGKLRLVNIHNVHTNDDLFTTHFDIIAADDKKIFKPLDISVPSGYKNF